MYNAVRSETCQLDTLKWKGPGYEDEIISVSIIIGRS
jgi:hypothetical protein